MVRNIPQVANIATKLKKNSRFARIGLFCGIIGQTKITVGSRVDHEVLLKKLTLYGCNGLSY